MVTFMPGLAGFAKLPVKTYRLDLTLDRLSPGVDNLRIDVRISGELHTAVDDLAYRLMARMSKSRTALNLERTRDVEIRLMDSFKQYCSEVMLSAVHLAKKDNEPQVDVLVQVAIIKMIREAVRVQFDQLIKALDALVRENELSQNYSLDEVFQFKRKLTQVNAKQAPLQQAVYQTLFALFQDVQKGEIQKTRHSHFGDQTQIPEDVLRSPLLYLGDDPDAAYMLEHYALIGHRREDLLEYGRLVGAIQDFYGRIDSEKRAVEPLPPLSADASDNAALVSARLTQWSMQVENVVDLLDYRASQKAFNQIRRLKKAAGKRAELKAQIRLQRRLLGVVYKKFQRAGLLKAVCAAEAIAAVYTKFCPPLHPQDLLRFMLKRRDRRQITARFKRLTNNQISLRPLITAMKSLGRLKRVEKEKRLLRFLHRFSSYHRDFENLKRLNDAMTAVNLAVEDRIILLSRANHTLYEFLLGYEHVPDEQPVLNHVIVKTDVRGSTDITYQLNRLGLNPASFFSLNFFNPITDNLPEYGAKKVFIEGDAIILSLFEHDGAPGGWYAVSRACGLAQRMVQITQRYNLEGRKARLPNLEQGIGISYIGNAPAYLFDGMNRIMISPAINKADRMAGSTKLLRHWLDNTKTPFNLFVFQEHLAEDDGSADDRYLRYNVNGIEMCDRAFAKLGKEIKLTTVSCRMPGTIEEKCQLYTGTFPLISGRYMRVVVREARIPLIETDTLKVVGLTEKKYYEVCTHPKLFEMVEKLG